jgi:hypothetical protein
MVPYSAYLTRDAKSAFHPLRTLAGHYRLLSTMRRQMARPASASTAACCKSRTPILHVRPAQPGELNLSDRVGIYEPSKGPFVFAVCFRELSACVSNRFDGFVGQTAALDVRGEEFGSFLCHRETP